MLVEKPLTTLTIEIPGEGVEFAVDPAMDTAVSKV
jgi:hypothetical protein